VIKDKQKSQQVDIFIGPRCLLHLPPAAGEPGRVKHDDIKAATLGTVAAQDAEDVAFHVFHAAMLKAIESGKCGGVAIDVYEKILA